MERAENLYLRISQKRNEAKSIVIVNSGFPFLFLFGRWVLISTITLQSITTLFILQTKCEDIIRPHVSPPQHNLRHILIIQRIGEYTIDH